VILSRRELPQTALSWSAGGFARIKDDSQARADVVWVMGVALLLPV
jgi:hypothetical protein